MASAGKNYPSVDWAELPFDLLTSIARRIDYYEEEEEEEGNTHLRGFASLLKNGMVHKVELPEARRKQCIGSMGWLITIDARGGDLQLLHPLSRVRILLPHPKTYTYYEEERMSNYFCIRRAVLSASPSLTHDYVVMVIFASEYPYPAFWRPGNSIWTVIEPPDPISYYLDVIYYKDQFYAINRRSELVLCEVDGPNCGNAKVVGKTSYNAAYSGQPYLIESDGELLLVNRMYGPCLCPDTRYWSFSYEIYSFSTGFNNEPSWLERNDLGGGSVFVGHSAAIFVPPSAVAASMGGIRPNCVYFTYDYSDGYADKSNVMMGIYNFKTRDTEPLPIINARLSRCCPSVWVPPSF